ncbi:MAG: hypothetical protein ABJB61_00705, partial [bacterium]
QLTNAPGYDAETTISKQGKLVFTSMRDGDLDIYTMDGNGKHIRRLTNELGYDGGPFWSYDGKQIVYRAYHPQTEKEKSDYLSLLKQNLIRPTTLEIWVMNADGGDKRQVTRNGKANFAPYFFPDGKHIIFASNIDDPKGRNFDLYKIGVDGSGLERITFNDTFDGFPMFSPDGKKLVFASNRNAKTRGDTNIFIADWVELSKEGPSLKPTQTPVEVWCGADDGLTQGVRDALETAFASTPDFVLSSGKRTGTLLVTIPTHVRWKEIGERTQVFYIVEFTSADDKKLRTHKGSCWNDDFAKCANQIVARARIAARKVRAEQ